MFRRHTGITLLPIYNISTKNNAQHAYYTKQINHLKMCINYLLPWNKYME